MTRLLTVGAVAAAALAFAGNAFGSNINTNITTPTTWDATVNPVHVTATIHVQAPLTIADGETVQLDPGVAIIVDNGASLTSQGAATGVLITAFSGTSGGMAGILAQSGSTLTLTNTTISHGGDASGGPTLVAAQVVCQACLLSMNGDTVSGGTFTGVAALTNTFSINNNTFTNNTQDGIDVSQSLGGSGGTTYAFSFEHNTLNNNGIVAGRINSNELGSIDDNTGSGNTTNALFLAGQVASNTPVHINGNTIPLGLDAPPGGGAPTLAVTAAATLNIGPGQTFLGRNGGTIGALTGTLTIDGSTFDSLHGIPGEWGGIVAFNNTTLTITNTTISHGGDASGGPTLVAAQVVCQACLLSMNGDTVSGGTFTGVAALTNTFSINNNTFTNNTQDGIDVSQSLGGSGGTTYAFSFEHNTLNNNGIVAGRINSNELGSIDDNTGSGNTTNALFLAGQVASNTPVHINGNTIPLGLDAPPGGGAPTLAVTAAATLNIGPGQTFLGRNGGTIGALTGTLTIDGSTFDSLHGIPGEWGGIVAFNNTTLTITNTTISHGGDASGGPTLVAAQVVCQACLLSMNGDTVSGGTFTGVAALTNTFSINNNTFTNNTQDGIDVSQSLGGSGGTTYAFSFEHNTLNNNGIVAGRINSNELGSIDDNTGSGNTTNALFLAGQVASNTPVHINGNTIPLGLDAPPGGGAPTLAVTAAATLNIGPGQTFLGRNGGTIGALTGTLTIDGSTFDSLHGIPGEWAASSPSTTPP